MLAGRAPALDAYVLELGLVALLAFAVVPALAARPTRAAVAVAVGAGIALGSLVAPIPTIVVLAVLHNATPIGFLADRDDVRRRVMPACAVAFVAVPLLIASGALGHGLAALGLDAPDLGPPSAGTLDDHLRVFVLPVWIETPAARSIFAAGAYLQLLHYGLVLGVLPRLLDGGPAAADAPILPWPGRRLLVAAIVAIGLGFAVAFARTFVPTRARVWAAGVGPRVDRGAGAPARARRPADDGRASRPGGLDHVTQTSAFLLTLAVELPLVFAGAWLSGAPRPALRRLPWVALAANALTHPLLGSSTPCSRRRSAWRGAGGCSRRRSRSSKAPPTPGRRASAWAEAWASPGWPTPSRSGSGCGSTTGDGPAPIRQRFAPAVLT